MFRGIFRKNAAVLKKISGVYLPTFDKNIVPQVIRDIISYSTESPYSEFDYTCFTLNSKSGFQMGYDQNMSFSAKNCKGSYGSVIAELVQTNPSASMQTSLFKNVHHSVEEICTYITE